MKNKMGRGRKREVSVDKKKDEEGCTY